MAVLRRKSKIVAFRTSADEYDALARSSVESGARSVAEFARSAALERLRTSGAAHTGITGDIMTLGKTLRELDDSLGEIRNRIRQLLGSSAEPSGTRAGH
jgi:hypothetical protein